jgi:hypothetical protein
VKKIWKLVVGSGELVFVGLLRNSPGIQNNISIKTNILIKFMKLKEYNLKKPKKNSYS